MTNYTLTHNADFGSLEIRFDSMPTPAVRSALKTLRFRWHGVNRYWYGKADETAVRAQLDKLLTRAEKIAAANRKSAKTDRSPVAPTPKKTPAPVYTLLSVSEAPAPVPDPEEVPAAKTLPAREDLKIVKFSYRIGNAVGQSALTPAYLSAAPAAALKIILDMMDGIEDAEERENAYFTLAAVAWYDMKEKPEKAPRFRQLSALYREKTGNDFPDPDAKTDGKPASPKTVSSALKRFYRKAPEGSKGVQVHDGCTVVNDGYHAVFLRSSAPDLPTLPPAAGFAAASIDLLHKFEAQPHPGTLPLPTVRELKAWLKTSDEGKRDVPRYSLDGVEVNAKHLLDMLEALPGCTALRPENFPNPVIFTSGEDRGILMTLRPSKVTTAA